MKTVAADVTKLNNMGKNRSKNKGDNQVNAKAAHYPKKLGKFNTRPSTVPTVTATSVYKRRTDYPGLFPDYPGPKDRFIVPGDPKFDEVLKTCYGGFASDPEEAFPASFHKSFMTALDGLEKEDAYQFDLTQPAGLGTKVAKTFVTRCLVGEAGTTYKYLGLRMFAIPWNEGEIGASESALAIGRLNQRLISSSRFHLKATGKKETEIGSCEFNLTLINKCFPVAESTLKLDPSFGKDKVTVSWHADSTLDHFSTIAIYHCTKPSAAIDADSSADKSSFSSDFQDNSWRVAMRVWLDAEGPNQGKPSSRTDEMRSGQYVAPAVAVALPKKAVYYLLDDFNHHHQHAVLAGTTHRYASTHRVCRTDGHTYQSIKSRCVAALQGTDRQYAVAKVRAEQLAMSEVEFEWIRQFYVQGQKHHDFHGWWRAAMAVLLEYYSQLQLRTLKTLETLYDAATGVDYPSSFADADGTNSDMSNRDRKTLAKRKKAVLSVDAESYSVMATALKERVEKRNGWRDREADKLYLSVDENCRPMTVPIKDMDMREILEQSVVLKEFKGKTLLELSECVLSWKTKFESK